MTKYLAEIIPLLLWAILWALGGIWIARTAFNLRDNEQAMFGLGLGLVLQNWLVNLLAQVIPFLTAIWASAGLVFLMGLIFSWPEIRKNPRFLIKIPIHPLQWITLLLLAYVFIAAGRGLAIQDDFQNLPITSVIATGDVPPHFALNPTISFGYHYFSMLFAGQLIHMTNIAPWIGLDVARGFAFALSLMITGLWVERVTGSVLAGFLGGLWGAFAGGTRWLLLLLPTGLLMRISEHINIIGSGANTAPDLLTAMTSDWAVAGAGPYPFPFAFVNGFNTSSVMIYHTGAGGLAGVASILLLMSHNRWRTWRAWVIATMLLAATAISNEVTFARLVVDFYLIALVYMAVKRTIRMPQSLWRWLVVLIPAGVIALFQGGVLTGITSGWLAEVIPGLDSTTRAYHTFNFSFYWPPAFLSTHLGFLQLTDPYQAFVALLEIGPVILVIPLMFIWGVKAFRHERWYESAFILVAFLTLVLAFVQYSGTAGVTAMTRAQSILVGACKTFAVPAIWLWVRHRSQPLKVLSGVFFAVCMLGGMVLFGIQLIAAPKPVVSYYLNDLDARMTQEYWNRLEKGVLIFDPEPERAPVVFGRLTKSSTDWFTRLPEWDALVETPDPKKLHAFGFDYAYIDQSYVEHLPSELRPLLEQPCVKLVKEYTQVFPEDFRQLLDIRSCH